jgi:hypothetical protein
MAGSSFFPVWPLPVGDIPLLTPGNRKLFCCHITGDG